MSKQHQLDIQRNAELAHPPLPPFTRETAIQKVRLAEDAWNSRDPEKVALAYTIDSRWRNRAEFVNGRQEIVAFLTRKWAKELDYRLIKELWTFTDIAGCYSEAALAGGLSSSIRVVVDIAQQADIRAQR